MEDALPFMLAYALVVGALTLIAEALAKRLYDEIQLRRIRPVVLRRLGIEDKK